MKPCMQKLSGSALNPHVKKGLHCSPTGCWTRLPGSRKHLQPAYLASSTEWVPHPLSLAVALHLRLAIPWLAHKAL